MSNAVVEVHNLIKTYGQKVAVADVSFAVVPGEIFGILGPNGSGKTTAVECIAGLRDADGGQIRVLGIDPQVTRSSSANTWACSSRRPGFTTRSPCTRRSRSSRASTTPADVDELLTVLDLKDKRDAQFKSLSGGQKQRVSIALALIGNPKLAILDELSTGLDPQARRTTWEVVRRERDAGATVLLVTHFMEEAERLCDRLVIIDHGRIIAEGSPQDLINSVEGAQSLENVFVALTPRPAAASTIKGA